jgi:hypothetical protein
MGATRDVVCRSCGRQVLGPGAAPARGVNRLAAKALVAAVALGALVLIAAVVVARLLPPRPGVSQFEREQALLRVVRENHAFDDTARQALLKEALDGRGHRCDGVTLMLMTSPGTWSVECTPGRRYRVVFDEAGQPASAVRLR